MAASSSRCSLRVQDGRHTLYIEHFAARSTDVGQCVASPVFELAGQRWYVKVYPGGNEESSEGFVSVFLERPESETGSIRAQFLIRLKNTDKFIDPVRNEVREFKPAMGWGYLRLAKREDVLSPNSGFLADGTLAVYVLLRVYGDPVEAVEQAKVEAPTGLSLREALRSALTSGDQADVQVRAGDAMIPAHSFVLGVRSPVFRAMFSGEMREAQTKTVDLNAEEATARAFLEFLYCDEVDLSSLDLCCHLLKLAHRFEVVGLVGACVSTLEKGLDVPSAVERLMLADELELPGLKAVCCAYLAWPERLPQAQASPQWERLVEQRPRLMAELLRAVAPPRKRGPEERCWSVLSLAELRLECSSRRLPTSGSKAILIDRLSKQ